MKLTSRAEIWRQTCCYSECCIFEVIVQLLKSEESYNIEDDPTATGERISICGVKSPPRGQTFRTLRGKRKYSHQAVALNIVDLITQRCLVACSSMQPYCHARRRTFLLLHQSMPAQVQIRMLAGTTSLCPASQALNDHRQASSQTRQAEPWSCHPPSHSFAPPIIASSLPSFAHSMQPL